MRPIFTFSVKSLEISVRRTLLIMFIVFLCSIIIRLASMCSRAETGLRAPTKCPSLHPCCARNDSIRLGGEWKGFKSKPYPNSKHSGATPLQFAILEVQSSSCLNPVGISGAQARQQQQNRCSLLAIFSFLFSSLLLNGSKAPGLISCCRRANCTRGGKAMSDDDEATVHT